MPQIMGMYNRLLPDSLPCVEETINTERLAEKIRKVRAGLK
jgi:hypothetical protein